MLFKITDDSGFLAVVDPDAYDGFVGSNWTWDTLQDRFVREAREQHLLVWSTGIEHVWSIDVLFQQVELNRRSPSKMHGNPTGESHQRQRFQKAAKRR
jgi:hypothetical protein